MAALTDVRDTKKWGARPHLDELSIQVKAATKIYAGSLVAISSADGYAVPGATSTTQRAMGRAEETVDNSGGANGDKSVRVRRGVFKWGNSAAGDAITIADVGADCFIVDDQTVAKTNGTNTRSVAGKIMGVDTDGVWVQIA